ncbi:MAG: hypothetical protein ABI912_06725 [Actinomycetota bacterium]
MKTTRLLTASAATCAFVIIPWTPATARPLPGDGPDTAVSASSPRAAYLDTTTITVCGVTYRNITPQLAHLIRTGTAIYGGGTAEPTSATRCTSSRSTRRTQRPYGGVPSTNSAS